MLIQTSARMAPGAYILKIPARSQDTTPSVYAVPPKQGLQGNPPGVFYVSSIFRSY